jgi:hypothetical protein
MRKHATAACSTVVALRDASIVKRASAASSSPVKNSHSARCNSSAKMSAGRRPHTSSANNPTPATR